MYTGGTTGVPKGAEITHGNISSNLQQLKPLYEVVKRRRGEQQLVMMGVLPWYHIYGQVTVMLYALRMLKETPTTVYTVATVQEEVGLRGAQIAAEKVSPHYAIALDTTIAADVPGVPERQHIVKVGKGPAIKVIDGGRGGLFIAHPPLRNHIIKVAEELGIPFQLEVLYGGTTDAMKKAKVATALEYSGYKTATAISRRYMERGRYGFIASTVQLA